MIEARINRETLWHDGPNSVTVPAGEWVRVVTLDQIPDAIDRNTISDGIKAYQKQGRKFVAIKIRTWYGLIDSTWLEELK